MNEDHNSQPPTTPSPPLDSQNARITPPSMTAGEKVIQPSESMKLEFQSQQVQPQTPQPVEQSAPNPQPIPTHNHASVYPDPSSTQMHVGVSASQLGLHESKNKLLDFNPKHLIVKGLVGLMVIGVILAVLVMTNIIALSEFKNTSYTNSAGTNFKLDFYTKHSSNQLKSGNTQLVSKISKDGKFPIAVSISTTDEMSGYNRAKDCSNFTKVFEVQNSNLNQNISVCDFGKQGNLPADSVYIAGFKHNDKAHIVTIGQDYGSIDLSSQSGAQASLAKFGMEPYRADIEKIVSSINVE